MEIPLAVTIAILVPVFTPFLLLFLWFEPHGERSGNTSSSVCVVVG